ncbi:hypothetical protein GCM10008171_01670 [Methylopila jiangsuensis]|uniref:DUF4365 domain-containing protein n=1 Tax=Methylopila jiangsuensis TaxID=586230 RepID=A0A9W6JFR8_9HYPH|nr:DUF4365 domain-containing protein [Methylopila jiangsuensis]MDR6287334.1 hypothetical protein [Methylopila jiangsuensis]GLK74914.1 hypothetical protein GCM10008171_01670 [Methylopila jiangsuensis]
MTTDNTSRRGVNAVEAIFLEMGWLFREQHASDFGIDAHVEIMDGDQPTGKLVGLQIKSGPSFFRPDGDRVVFRGSARHLEYWSNHSLPVLLVLHDPTTGLTIWRRVERHHAVVKDDGSWTVDIPRRQVLTAASGTAIERCLDPSDPRSRREQRLAVDADLIRRTSENGEVFLVVDDWVNKSLNIRGAKMTFIDPNDADDDGENVIDFYMPARSLSTVLDLFPWAKFAYHLFPHEADAEVTVHTFRGELNELGLALLKLEEFYREGAEPNDEPELPDPSPETMGAAEYAEYAQNKAWHEDMEWEHQERMSDPER